MKNKKDSQNRKKILDDLYFFAQLPFMILANIRPSVPQLGSACLNLFLGLTLIAHADESLLGDSTRQVQDQAEQKPASARRQVPTTKKALEAAVENAPNTIAPPLPAGSPKLDVLRARAANLQKQQAAFQKNVAAGKVTPFPDLAEARPQHDKEVAALVQSANAAYFN